MAGVSETIAREYFELHEFLVRQPHKHVGQTRGDVNDDIDFFVLNPHPQTRAEVAPFVFSSADLPFLERAVVVVKGWHTDTFSSARLTASPEIIQFVESKNFQQAARTFGKDGMAPKILVVPALPQDSEARDQSISLLRSKGIDAVIPFRTMLNDLVWQTQVNRNYQKSDLLQTIRLLKNYDFLKEPQMELFKPKRTRARKS
jgi:hypothetical protein